jgi:hypothetical protein
VRSAATPERLSEAKDPGRNKVRNNEGAAARRQQGARKDNILEYSTAKDGGSAKRLSATIVAD